MLSKLSQQRRNQIISLRNEILRSCLNCGSTWLCEFAHVKPTNLRGMGRGQKERFLDILRHLDSYTYLCKKCHERFDCGDKTVFAPVLSEIVYI